MQLIIFMKNIPSISGGLAFKSTPVIMFVVRSALLKLHF